MGTQHCRMKVGVGEYKAEVFCCATLRLLKGDGFGHNPSMQNGTCIIPACLVGTGMESFMQGKSKIDIQRHVCAGEVDVFYMTVLVHENLGC